MKTLNILTFVILFSVTLLSHQSNLDTIPRRFWGVAENEGNTFISTNNGLYILERDSNNTFSEIFNLQDSLGLLHIHSNYLISGNDDRLKIFNISQPTNPLLVLDSLISYPISEFKNLYL